MSSLENFIQTTGGKVAIGVVLVLAVVAIGWQVIHMSDGEKSRSVGKTEAISEAQQQINAINGMTNLTPEAKKSLISHFQGQIDTANGGAGRSGGPAAGAGAAAPPAGGH